MSASRRSTQSQSTPRRQNSTMPSSTVSRSVRYYPSGATNVNDLNEKQKRLKIARHSPCSVSADGASFAMTGDIDTAPAQSTCDCSGYYPPPSTKLKSLSVKTATAANLDESQWGWNSCKCGHDMKHHGLLGDTETEDEFTRRAKVALRMDELLEVRTRHIVGFVLTVPCRISKSY